MSILERRKNKASRLSITGPIAAIAAVGFINNTAHGASPIGAGDVLVYQAGTPTATNSVDSVPLIIDDFSTATPGTLTLVQQFNISSSAIVTQTLVTNSNGSNGILNLSNAGTAVTFGGYVGPLSTTTPAYSLAVRSAVAISANGTVTEPTTYTDTMVSGTSEQVRSVYSPDGSTYVFGTKDGIYTNGQSTPATSTNVTDVASYGGITYAISANTKDFYTYSSGVLTPVAVPTGTLSGSATNFAFVQSGATADAGYNDGYDTLYIANNKTILKYYDNNGVFTLDSTFNTGLTLTAITAVQEAGGTVTIYATANNNTIDQFTDTTAYNSAAGNTLTLAATSLYTATSSVGLFGLVEAPGVVASLTQTETNTDVGATITTSGTNHQYADTSYYSGTGLIKGSIKITGPLASDELAPVDVLLELTGTTAGIATEIAAIEGYGSTSTYTGYTTGNDFNNLTAEYGFNAANSLLLVFNFNPDPPAGEAFNFDLTNGTAEIDQIVAVPEPTSMGLLGAAGLGMLSRRRRRPAKHKPGNA